MTDIAWTPVSAGPWSRRRKHQAVVWKDRILLLGGFDGEKAFDLNDVWSWDGTVWSEICPKAEWSGRDGHCAIVFNEAIYVLGGTDDPYNCRSDIWRSDNGGSAWNIVLAYAPWPERWQHAACVHDGKMYILGGWGDTYLSDVWCSHNGTDWQQVCAQAPWRARMFLSAVSFNDAIYVIGGHDGRQQLRDVWASSDGGATWTQVCQTAQWEARQGHACVVLNGEVYIMGGFGGGLTRFNDLWKSADCAHWTLVSRHSSWTARQGHSSVVSAGAIYVLGGFDAAGYCNDMFSLTLQEASFRSLAGRGAAGSDALAGATNASRYAGRRSPKTVTVSLLCAFESISDLRERRAYRDCLLRSVADMLAMVASATGGPLAEGDDASAAAGAATVAGAGAAMSGGGEADGTAERAGPVAAGRPLSEAAFELSPREAFIQSMPTSPPAAEPKANADPNASALPTPAPSSLELHRLLQDNSRALSRLQREIRSASEKNEPEAVEALVAQRQALARTQFAHASSLMEHVSAVRRAQDRQQAHLARVLARIESFHLIGGGASFFLSSSSGDGQGEPNDGLLPDEGSQCTLEEWEGIAQAYLQAAQAVSPDQADESIAAFGAALASQARLSARAAEWVLGGVGAGDEEQAGEMALVLPSLPTSPATPQSPQSPDGPLAPSPQTHITARLAPNPALPFTPDINQLSNDCQDAEEDSDRTRMAVKTCVDSELSSMRALEGATKALLRTSMEKGCGLVKRMITQVRLVSPPYYPLLLPFFLSLPPYLRPRLRHASSLTLTFLLISYSPSPAGPHGSHGAGHRGGAGAVLARCARTLFFVLSPRAVRCLSQREQKLTTPENKLPQNLCPPPQPKKIKSRQPRPSCSPTLRPCASAAPSSWPSTGARRTSSCASRASASTSAARSKRPSCRARGATSGAAP